MEVPDRHPHEARMLHCSSCGGKLRAQAAKCQYCGGEVGLGDRRLGAACPQCFARLPSLARFCNECGVKIDPRPLRAMIASAVCPRCKGKLVLREFAQGSYTECTACGGIWLDAKSFERVVEDRDESAMGELALVSRKGAAKGGAASEKVAYLPCPVCGNLMHRKNYAGCSGVIIDWCKGHGCWFDALELEKVIEFVRAGGLDRSRKMEIERARDELTRLKEQQRAASALGSGWAVQERSAPDWGFDLGEAFTTILRRFI
jgi:Zn-finger nucleic acid-binding protein